ncbi:MAG: hypothetical protein A2901_08165 [Elusimicrobia bacterium RIFCSPLOWO2_01_FULL_54_10]|nr:MAG: hypothetical protein A2901_08165 [Elusimicrobia bacterium RIFCSPLOWO2_01_FULL_54_10]
MKRDSRLVPLPGGINNKVFRVNVNGRSFLLKIYFQHPGDPRDRLGVEFSFSQYAWNRGIRCIPQPLFFDTNRHLALYEFIEGNPVDPNRIHREYVSQSIDFFHALNRHQDHNGDASLPVASEASFTIAGYLHHVDSRMRKLLQIDRSAKVHRDAFRFVDGELRSCWERERDRIIRNAHKLNMDIEVRIKKNDRCLSPSDFGFHNAILASDRRLRFIDFEYAGWDDPTKTVCDYFCQPAFPVPMRYFELFTNGIVVNLSEPEKFVRRIHLLFPLHRIKWCCIILNDFLQVDAQRRGFAAEGADQDEMKVNQLKKARRYLSALQALPLF